MATLVQPIPSDLDIAQAAQLKPIAQIADELGLDEDDVELYGKFKAKIALEACGRLANRPLGKYIDVTCITPTPLGEGKTTTTVGLGQGLAHIGKKAVVCIRQPSLGPVFGIKGGAAGGGYAQIVPMEDFNLHLTGDNHAVSAAHNLLAAFVDNSLAHKNPLGIDPKRIVWRRVLDVSDRSLRNVIVGLGGPDDGVPRETGFDMAAASEVMAILALATDLQDLRRRLGRIIVAYTGDGVALTAEDVHCAGAMAVLMKDAIKPTLLQTLENTPAFVHAGPFGNIAHGNSSIVADQLALRLGDYCVTESGFGADLGMEKFVDIKCRTSGLRPDAVVMVCTIRALKAHSGQFKIVAGRPLDPGLATKDLAALEAGSANLIKQIENARTFGLPVVVAINRFGTDAEEEIALVKRISLEANAEAACVFDGWAAGGAGAAELAEAVVSAAGKANDFHFLYDLNQPIKAKIEAIAVQMYGAAGVNYLAPAEKAIRTYTEMGYHDLPICMAKTHLSLSHIAELKGRPSGFVVPVRDVRLSAGAGFLYVLLGDMRTMPGLPSEPAGNHIDIDEHGRIVGLF